MKKIFFLFSFLFFSGICSLSAQWLQVGSDIDGPTGGNGFGASVSLSADGERMAIGGSTVRVYSESGSAWSQLGSEFGVYAYSVSLSADGKRLAFGIPNIVRVYIESGGVWSQLGSDIGAYGQSICLSSDGKRLAIGNPQSNANGPLSGHVQVYSESGGVWSQLGSDINGEAEGDVSGISISLSADGKRLAIGAPGNGGNGNGAGHVRVYSESGGVWLQLGSDINGEAAFDNSGSSVSLSSDGKRLAIGAPSIDAGHVRVYSESGGIWSQLGSGINGEATSEHSGHSVSLSADGKRLAIGAPYNNNFDGWFGHVRVYSESGSIWSQMGNDIDGEGLYDESGTSVSLSADGILLAVGAPQNGTDYFAGIVGAGHVRVYAYSESSCQTTWYADDDGDGYGNASSPLSACIQPVSYVSDNSDCNDSNPNVRPGAQEICNGIDDDCDGLIDDDDDSITGQLVWYLDADNDGYGNPDVSVFICNQPSGYVGTGTDCNDANALIYPDAPEIADGKDNDCDGRIDEGITVINVEAGDCEIVYYGYAPSECHALSVSASGGSTPYTYLWSTGATSQSTTVCPQATTIYTVTVTDHNGSTAKDKVTVQVIDVRCGNNNDKVLVCHNPNSNSNTLCVAPNAVSAHLAHGDYLGVCGTSSPCSGGQNQSMVIEQVDAELEASRNSLKKDDTNNNEQKVMFMVMPNPANDHIEVHTNLVPGTIILMDINGRVIIHQDAIGYKNSINAALLSDGFYFIRVENGTNCFMKSIVVIH